MIVRHLSPRNRRRVVFSLALYCLAPWLTERAEALEPPRWSAGSLHASFTNLQPQLAQNQYGRPIYLESADTGTELTGELYAQVNYPLVKVKLALGNPANWCDLLLLHIHTKHCSTRRSESGNEQIAVHIGSKEFQRLDQAYPLDFSYRVDAAEPGYLDISLVAAVGPMGTSDYQIRVEAVPLLGGATFLHLRYAYSYNFLGNLAMRAYLSTVGLGKVGFTQLVPTTGKTPYFIGGARGVMERNTMRYFLAVDADLAAMAEPPGVQSEKRLANWFAQTQAFPSQFRDLDRDTYLDVKRREYRRQVEGNTR